MTRSPTSPAAGHLRVVPCLDPEVSDGALSLLTALRAELGDVPEVTSIQVRQNVDTVNPPTPEEAVHERRVEASGESLWVRVVHADRPIVAKLVRCTLDLLEARQREEAGFSERATMRQRFAAVQTRMVERSRLAALGTLVSGLTHDLRSPLTVLAANHEYLLQLSRQVAPAIREEMDPVLDDDFLAIESIEGILDSLRSFAGSDQACRPMALEPVLRSAVRLTQLHFRRRGVEIALDVDPGLKAVGTEEEVCQIAMNLLMNAADAAPQGSVVQLMARGDGDMAVVCVADDGPGVPEGAHEMIFEPFHTSKPSGMGLGLSIAREMAVRQGGTLRVLEEPPAALRLPPAGASFELRLPTR